MDCPSTPHATCARIPTPMRARDHVYAPHSGATRARYISPTHHARERRHPRARATLARARSRSHPRGPRDPSRAHPSVGISPSVRALATTRTRDRARESKRRNVLCVMHLRRRRAVALHGRGAVVCDARARRPIAPRLGGVRRTCAFVAFAACRRKTLCIDGCAFHRSRHRSTSPRAAFFACTSSRGAD